MEWKVEGERKIKIIFCCPTSTVHTSQQCTHSFIHMTEPEFVKVNVEQVTVSKVFCILRDFSPIL